LLGEDFSFIFEELNSNFLILEQFFLANEAMVSNTLTTQANGWASESMKFLNGKQMAASQQTGGRGIIALIGKVFKALINLIIFGLVLMLIAAVIMIAVGHLLVKVWNALSETIKKLFDAIMKVVQVHQTKDMLSKLVTIQEKIEGIEMKSGRDSKRIKEMKDLKFEVIKMQDVVREGLAAQRA